MLGSVPFTFVIVGVAWCWIKALREETRRRRTRAAESLDVSDARSGDRDERPPSGRRERPARRRARAAPGRRGRCSPCARGVRRDQRRARAPPSSRRAPRCGSRWAPRTSRRRKILGELWRQALAVNGYTVDLRKGVGPAADLDQALQDGDIDGYVAYTGTVLSIVAGEDGVRAGPRGDLRAGQGASTPTSDMVDERDDAVREQGRDRHHHGPSREANDLTSIADLADARRRSCSVRGPEFEDLYLGLAGPAAGLRADQRRRSRRSRWAQQYAALDNGDGGRGRRLHHRPAAARPATTRCSTTRSCCSARRTSSWSSARTSWTRSTPTRSWPSSTPSTAS